VNNFFCFTFGIFQIVIIKNSKFSFASNFYFFDLGPRKDNFEFCFIFLKIPEVQFNELNRKHLHQLSNHEIKNLNSLLKNLFNFEYYFYNESLMQILFEKLFLIKYFYFINSLMTNFYYNSKNSLEFNSIKLRINNSELIGFKNNELILNSQFEDSIKITLKRILLQFISCFSIQFEICNFNKNNDLEIFKIFKFMNFKNGSIQFDDFITYVNLEFFVFYLNQDKNKKFFPKHSFKKILSVNIEPCYSLKFCLINLLDFCFTNNKIKRKYLYKKIIFLKFNSFNFILCSVHLDCLNKLFETTKTFSNNSTIEEVLNYCTNKKFVFEYYDSCHNCMSLLINSINDASNIFNKCKNYTNQDVLQCYTKRHLPIKQSDMAHNCLSSSANTTYNSSNHDNLCNNSPSPAVLHQHADNELSMNQSDMAHNCLSSSANTTYNSSNHDNLCNNSPSPAVLHQHADNELSMNHTNTLTMNLQ